MASRPRTALAVGALVLAAAAGCGGGERDVTLTITDVSRTDRGTVTVTTECASRVRVEVGPDAGGSDAPQLSAFGDPEVGRCRPQVRVPVPPGTTKVVDAATSKVIEVPAAG